MRLSHPAQFGALALAIGLSSWGLPQAHALSYTTVDLHPTGVNNSLATSIDGGQIAGMAGNAIAPFPNFPFVYTNAYKWSNLTPTSATNINPTTQTFSRINAISGSQSIGTGRSFEGYHALLWTSATTTVDLNRAFDESFGIGISGNQQVGVANGLTTDFSDHAILWSSSAQNPVDLHVATITPPTGDPITFTSSIAYGISGSKQVGQETFTDSDFLTNMHAFMWGGSASNYVDLNGSLFGSVAYAIDGNDQVGMGYTSEDGLKHAILWHNTANSAIDLTPVTMESAEALAVRNGVEVGYASPIGSNGDTTHAMLWLGSSDSAVDLHDFLPAGYTDSRALAIDADGTIVGFAVTEMGRVHAVAWIPTVPEPATVSLLLVGMGLLARRRR